MLDAQSNGRLSSWQPFDDMPHVYQQHLTASKSDSTILLVRHFTCQDDVQRDDRMLLLQAFQLPYSSFQCPIVVSKNYSPFHTTFQQRNCVSSVGLNHVKKVKVAKHPYFRGYHLSRANQQHFRETKSIMMCTAVWELHNINTKRKLGRLVFEYNQNI